MGDEQGVKQQDVLGAEKVRIYSSFDDNPSVTLEFANSQILSAFKSKMSQELKAKVRTIGDSKLIIEKSDGKGTCGAYCSDNRELAIKCSNQAEAKLLIKLLSLATDLGPSGKDYAFNSDKSEAIYFYRSKLPLGGDKTIVTTLDNKLLVATLDNKPLVTTLDNNLLDLHRHEWLEALLQLLSNILHGIVPEKLASVFHHTEQAKQPDVKHKPVDLGKGVGKENDPPENSRGGRTFSWECQIKCVS